MSAGMFPSTSDYHNFVPTQAVRARLRNEGAPGGVDHLTGAGALRKMALAHSLAADAARARVWRGQGGQLSDPVKLSLAAAQLYLRAARHEELHLRRTQEWSARALRDRSDAALEFLVARRQAIAAAVLSSIPALDLVNSSPDEIILSLHRAVWDSIRRAGRPDAEGIRRLLGSLESMLAKPLDGADAARCAAALAGARMLETFASALGDGQFGKVSDVLKDLGALDQVLEKNANAEVADLLSRFLENVPWLIASSVWQLPREIGLDESPTGRELVGMLLSDEKHFLFAPQWDAIRSSGGVACDRMNILSMPTGSGKSLLAELMVVKHLEEWVRAGLKDRRAFFIVPSRALAREKMLELRRMLAHLGSLDATVCQLTGDVLLNAEEAIRLHNVIVATPEKFDMIFRVPELRPCIGAVVVDEFHNIREGARGLRLLATLARLRRSPETLCAKVHLVSAIVRDNDLENVSRWLTQRSSDHVASFRSTETPIFTRCGVFDYGSQRNADTWNIEYDDGTQLSIAAPTPPGKRTREEGAGGWGWNQHVRAAQGMATALVDDGPILLFATSARWQWADGRLSAAPIRTAIELARSLKKLPDWVDKDVHGGLLGRLRRLWGDSEILEAARKGVVPHWGGLPLRGRKAIEDAVLKRGVAVLVATSTLAEGVNLPLRRLIIPKCTIHNEPFKKGFFLNLKGRAGRPFLTEEGEVILVASRDTPLEQVNKFRCITPEDVEPLESPLQTLARERLLRTLALDGEESGSVAISDVEDALDSMVLAMAVEQSVSCEEAPGSIARQLAISEDEYFDAAVAEVASSLRRLEEWNLLLSDACYQPTGRGRAVYNSGFSPRDAVTTTAALDDISYLAQLQELLPDSPLDGGAKGALYKIFELMAKTGIWRNVERAAVKSARQAALYMLHWTRGETLESIGKQLKADRLYLHSVLEGTLAPAAAWFFYSMSAWLGGVSGASEFASRLERWAEYAWFGAPPGPALMLMKRDFGGGFHRDDALRLSHALGRSGITAILSGTSRMPEPTLARMIGSGVPESVEAPEVIAHLLLELAVRQPE